MTTILFDLETDGFLDKMTKIHLIVARDEAPGSPIKVFSDDPRFGKDGTIADGVAFLRTATVMVGHNALTFDLLALAKMGYEFPAERVYDTMVAARLLNPERQDNSLAGWGRTLGEFKGDYTGDFQVLTEEMLAYAIQDVVVLGKLYAHVHPKLEGWGESVELEHRFARVIGMTMRNGFPLDIEKARALLADLTQERHDAAQAVIEAFGPLWQDSGVLVPKRDDAKRGYAADAPLTKVKLVDFNPASRHHIEAKLRAKYGWKPKAYTSSGAAKIDDAVIAALKYPEAGVLARYFKLAKMIGQLDGQKKKDGSGGGWLQHVTDEGRVHGYINSCGAVTGRCTHSKPNLAQVDKSKRMRECWSTRRGWVLLGCDAEGLELRMLGHYLGYYDGGTYANAVVHGKKDDGTDAHSLTQRAVGLFSRDGAKTFIYALIYGAGDPKLGSIIRQDAIDTGNPVPPGTVKALGAAARAKVETGIVGFGKLKRAVLQKVRLSGWLRGLDGRRLIVRSPHAALNTLLQSGGAVLMKKAAAEFYGRHKTTHGTEWAFCANVHDEVQIEVKDRETAEMLGKSFADCITQAGQHFKLRCPFSGAYDIGSNWSETH